MSDERTLTPAIATVTKMLEPLPRPAQERVVEHLREYLLDMDDEAEWTALIDRTQPQLIEAAQRARREIAEGLTDVGPITDDELTAAGTGLCSMYDANEEASRGGSHTR